MRIVVIGRTGQVARELIRQCPAGATLTALGRDAVDLADPAAAAEMVGSVSADVIINAAAYTAVDRAEDEPDLAERVNALAPGAMARVAAARQIPFLHLSTDYVYDGAGSAPHRPDGATGPLNVYGRTKLSGDHAIAEAGGAHVILRTSWVFSAHGENFVTTMLRLGREQNHLRIVADQVGGPTPASDIAATLLKIARTLRAEPRHGGVFHYAGAPDVSWSGFARAIFEAAGLDARIEDIASGSYPTRARRPSNSRLDCRSLQIIHGIARPDWRAGLAGVLREVAA